MNADASHLDVSFILVAACAAPPNDTESGVPNDGKADRVGTDDQTEYGDVTFVAPPTRRML